jgi:hypothetical protein
MRLVEYLWGERIVDNYNCSSLPGYAREEGERDSERY